MSNSLISQLHYPFTTPVHSAAVSIETSTREWVQKFRLVSTDAPFQRFCSINYGWLGARFFPYASFEAACLGSHWIAWLFILDDEFDELPVGREPAVLSQVCQKFIDILQTQESVTSDVAPTPLFLGLRDLQQRTLNMAPSPEWMQRFITSVRDYFAACIWESQNRNCKVPPSLETYITMRQQAGAQALVVALMECLEEVVLPDRLLTHPRIQSLIVATENLTGWVNDILSVQKEIRAGDVYNLVLVLKHEYDVSLEQAISLAIDMHNQEMRRFVMLADPLPDMGNEYDPLLQRYVTGLKALVRGTLDWTAGDALTRYTVASTSSSGEPGLGNGHTSSLVALVVCQSLIDG